MLKRLAFDVNNDLKYLNDLFIDLTGRLGPEVVNNEHIVLRIFKQKYYLRPSFFLKIIALFHSIFLSRVVLKHSGKVIFVEHAGFDVDYHFSPSREKFSAPFLRLLGLRIWLFFYHIFRIHDPEGAVPIRTIRHYYPYLIATCSFSALMHAKPILFSHDDFSESNRAIARGCIVTGGKIVCYQLTPRYDIRKLPKVVDYYFFYHENAATNLPGKINILIACKEVATAKNGRVLLASHRWASRQLLAAANRLKHAEPELDIWIRPYPGYEIDTDLPTDDSSSFEELTKKYEYFLVGNTTFAHKLYYHGLKVIYAEELNAGFPEPEWPATKIGNIISLPAKLKANKVHIHHGYQPPPRPGFSAIIDFKTYLSFCTRMLEHGQADTMINKLKDRIEHSNEPEMIYL